MQSVSVAGAETHKAAHETPTNGEHLADTYIRHLPVYIAQLRRRTCYQAMQQRGGLERRCVRTANVCVANHT